MDIDKKLLKRIDFIVAVFLLIIILCISIKHSNKHFEELKTDGELTVGITKGMTYGGQTGRYVHYEYCVLGEKYKEKQDCRYWNRINIDDGKFIIVYSKKNPQFSFALFKKETTAELCEEIKGQSLEEAGFEYWDFFWYKGS